mgnify:CR=1 FL=1
MADSVQESLKLRVEKSERMSNAEVIYLPSIIGYARFLIKKGR